MQVTCGDKRSATANTVCVAWDHIQSCSKHRSRADKFLLAQVTGRNIQLSAGDLFGLRAFLERPPACTAAVLTYNGRDAVKLDHRLWAIPMGHLLA